MQRYSPALAKLLWLYYPQILRTVLSGHPHVLEPAGLDVAEEGLELLLLLGKRPEEEGDGMDMF